MATLQPQKVKSMTLYQIETGNYNAVLSLTTSAAAAHRILTNAGFVQRQPVPDLDPRVECWWRGSELRRIIPVTTLD